jgi:hypothetical protein
MLQSVLVVALVAAGAWVAAPLAQGFVVAGLSFLKNAASYSDIINVRFAGRDLAIPRVYFQPWARPDLRDEPELLILRVYLPGFTTSPTKQPSDGGYGESVQIHLTRRMRSLNTSFVIAAPDRIFAEPIREMYGLRTFRTAKAAGDPDGRIHEIYFASENEVVTKFIDCEPSHRSPSCKETLSADGMSFEITYHMQYLPDWKSIEQRSIELVHGFARSER